MAVRPGSRDPSRLPVKQLTETHQEFMNRCMDDPVMLSEYPNPSQRTAVCMGQSGVNPKVGGAAPDEDVEARRKEVRMSGKVNFKW
jgi:hypothetical protein